MSAPSRRLRVLISSLSASAYGTDSYFRSLLPVLAEEKNVQCLLLVRDNRFDSLYREGGSITPVHCNVPSICKGAVRVTWEQFLLPRLAAELDCDVIYTATSTGVLRGDIPCVIAVRNMEPFVPANSGMPLMLRARLHALRKITEISARSSARVVAVSEFVRQTVESAGVSPDRIDTIYHGIDDVPELSATSRRGGYVAAAAKFVRYANLEMLVHAFGRLRQLGYSGDLHLAGGPHDHKYETKIRSLVAALGLSRNVRFLDYISRSAVHQLIHDSDVFLFPSRVEACPFTLLEAMRLGSAIVATTAPPMKEFCSDAALYSDPSDAIEFARLAHQLISNDDLQASIRAKAAKRARLFTWRDACAKLTVSWEKAACAS